MKHLKLFNEMANIVKTGKKLTINDKPLKDATIEQLSENILHWRLDKNSFLYKEGFTMVWFVDSDEAAKYLAANSDNLLFFPQKVGFTSSPITDIWLRNKPAQKNIIGALEASTFPDCIYIDMMSVRKGYMGNGINNMMIKFLIKEFPNAILKFSEPTKDGLAFIKKYYPNAKIEGKIDDSDIEYILKKLKSGEENHLITDKDISIISAKILDNPPKYGDYNKSSQYYRDVWAAMKEYALAN